MIPKVIHYCWLSGDPIPEKLQKYMKSWKEKLPDYEFVLWDKSSFDIRKLDWTKEAYECKKYAYAADYIRQFAVYEYGGFYLDMDVEVIKSFDTLLNRNYVLGAETEAGIEAGIFGAEKGSPIIKSCLEWYNDKHFINEDGSLNMITCPKVMFSCIEEKYKIRIEDNFPEDDNIVFLLPYDYLTAKSGDTGIVNITKNTYTVHHFAGSWLQRSFMHRFLHSSKTVFSHLLGEKIVRYIADVLNGRKI